MDQVEAAAATPAYMPLAIPERKTSLLLFQAVTILVPGREKKSCYNRDQSMYQ